MWAPTVCVLKVEPLDSKISELGTCIVFMTWRFVCWIAKPLYIWWLFVQVLHRSKKDGKQYAIKVQENRIELCLGSLYQVTEHELSSTLILVFDIFSMFKCSSKSMKTSPVMAIISCDYFLSSCKSRSDLPKVDSKHLKLNLCMTAQHVANSWAYNMQWNAGIRTSLSLPDQSFC
jgi:hypothetical protein